MPFSLQKLSNKFQRSVRYRYIMEKMSYSDWWRLSDLEEQDILNKEYDLGDGLKFKAKDIDELAKQVEVPAGPLEHHPEKNQLLHTNMVYDQSRKLSENPMVWFAAILHDLGKSHTDKSIWPKQHNHEELGVPYVEQVSNLLGVSREWKEFAMAAARYHLICHKAKEMSPRVLKKLFDAFGNDKQKYIDYITVCEADAKGRMGGLADRPYDQRDHMIKEWDLGWNRSTKPSTLAISGYDLMKEFPHRIAGPKSGEAGKWLGKVLSELNDLVLEHPEMNDRDTLVDVAKKLVSKMS